MECDGSGLFFYLIVFRSLDAWGSNEKDSGCFGITKNGMILYMEETSSDCLRIVSTYNLNSSVSAKL